MNQRLTLSLFFSLVITSATLLAQGDPRQGPVFKQNSALAQGRVYRIAVAKTGVYKIDFNFVRDVLKEDPAQVSPSRIAVFGNGGGRMPQWSGASWIDDIEQVPSFGIGFQDNQFNQGDQLLWYAEGPDKVEYDPATSLMRFDRNIYDNRNHYYIIIGGPERIDMSSASDPNDGVYVSVNSHVMQRVEDEKVNLLGRFRPPGSGQHWYGDEMSVVQSLQFAPRFDFQDMVVTDSVHFKIRYAVRANNLSTIQFYFNELSYSRNVGSVHVDDVEDDYAIPGLYQGSFVPGKALNRIEIRYPSASGVNSRAWADYVEMHFWKSNQYRSGQALLISDPRSRYLGKPKYEIAGLPLNAMVWNVSNPVLPVIQQYGRNTNAFFSGVQTTAGQHGIYIAFDPAQDLQTPEFEKVISNQNLHSLQRADMLIVYFDEFETAAMELAAHRRTHDQLVVEAQPVSKVFEEFGGGSKDPSAIRNFARMMYKRDPDFRYLLLMGDATYDYLNYTPELPYHNFIPAFETEESLDPIRSFPSDDFYALLDDDEGANLVGALDIAVGRFPVSQVSEAMDIVQKIIYYDTNPSTLHDWRNRIVMVADDEDGNTHVDQADNLAVKNTNLHPEFNQQKIYLDSYVQQSTPGGDRYPDVNSDLNLNVQRGALTITYLGHGGPNGWTQERVLGINQAQSYNNLDNLPLFLTATCSFAGYDEPGFTSTGEHLLSNPTGGAIALMTTVRAVFSGSNSRLTGEVMERLYVVDENGQYPSIGEVFFAAKNGNAIDTLDNNARKFTLLGDPALKLALPRHRVEVTEIQGKPVGPVVDTLSALEKVVIKGRVTDRQGQLLSDFGGVITVTIFDKPQTRKTLANDGSSNEKPFTTQTRQLFRGDATVNAGIWEIEFVLPKDIDFAYGAGKISMYAENGLTDASGFFRGVIIGGFAEDAIVDDEPPVIRLHMNNADFVSGGITDPNPYIYAILSDDNGINVSGTSIGHDIEAIIDGDAPNSLVLNDYYTALVDNYTLGEVRFPLQDLAPGRHTIRMTAWDVANNPAEAEIEFFVVEDEGALVTNLMNYPNPFDGITKFSFEHNRPGALVDVKLEIYAYTGQLLKTLELRDHPAGGYRVDELEWSGQQENGAQLPYGIYLYRAKATFRTGTTTEVVESEPGKLVLLR